MAHIEEDEIDLIDYIKVLVKRRWVILGVTLTSFIGTILYNRTLPPPAQVYEATASLLIIPPPVKSELISNLSVSVYQVLAEAQDLKENLIDELSLINDGVRLVPISSLNGMMRTTLISQSLSLIHISEPTRPY